MLNKLPTNYSHELVRISSKLSCFWVEKKINNLLEKALRSQTKLPFHFGVYLTSVVLNCQILISLYSAPLYKDEELVDLTVSNC